MEEYNKAIAGYDEVIRLESEYPNTGDDDDDDDEGLTEDAQYWRNEAIQKQKA